MFRGKRKIIFISYRRDDSPGYASKLEKDLEKHFGDKYVFRDVEDIPGGEEWKQVLADKLSESAVLLVIIGPRWEQIWNERRGKGKDYIVYELNEAKEQGIKIIPLPINGTKLSDDIDLGSVSWLKGKQEYGLMDQQGRWPNDVSGLVDLLDRIDGINRIKKTNKKWLWSLFAVLFLFWGLYQITSVPDVIPDPPESDFPERLEPVFTNPAESADIDDNFSSDLESETSVVGEPVTAPSIAVEYYPDVSGIWQAEDGTAYQLGQVTNGRFLIGNTEYQGEAQFFPNMPRKFTVKMPGLGHGEYSITTDNTRIVGWFIYIGSYEKEYETFWRRE